MIFDDNVLFGKKSCDVIPQYIVHILFYYHVLKKFSGWLNKIFCQALVQIPDTGADTIIAWVTIPTITPHHNSTTL